MLEVAFNSSIKGALKHAINYNPDSWRQGAMAFLGERPSDEELVKMYAGKPIGGNRADVVQFGFLMI